MTFMTEIFAVNQEHEQACRVLEQLSERQDFYGRAAIEPYTELINKRWTKDGNVRAQLAELSADAWEAANLGLFTLGVHDQDLILTDGAFSLLQRPSNKWRAAVWAAKQGRASLSWAPLLGEAKETAQTDTKEAFAVDLAELDLTLWQISGATGEQLDALEEQVATLINHCQYLLTDRRTYAKGSLVAQARLQLARILRDHGQFKQAESQRKLAGAAPADELEDFDAYLTQQKLLTKQWYEFRPSLVTEQLPNLIDIDGPTDDFDRHYFPSKAMAKKDLVVEVSRSYGSPISALDMMLRAGDAARAGSYYRQIISWGSPMEYPWHVNAGTRVQAAVLMHRHNPDAMVDAQIATIDAQLSLFTGRLDPSSHADSVELGNDTLSDKALWRNLFEAVKQLPNLRERTARLLTLSELSDVVASDDYAVRDEARRALQESWTLWVMAVPSDQSRQALAERAVAQQVLSAL